MSQKKQILKFLKTGQYITPFVALQICGSLRLSERIRELEADGIKIKKQMIKAGNTRVMAYWIK